VVQMIKEGEGANAATGQSLTANTEV